MLNLSANGRSGIECKPRDWFQWGLVATWGVELVQNSPDPRPPGIIKINIPRRTCCFGDRCSDTITEAPEDGVAPKEELASKKATSDKETSWKAGASKRRERERGWRAI